VKQNLPILIAVDFVNQVDNLIAFDLGRRMKDENGKPIGSYDPGKNARAYLQLKKDSLGELDLDLIEIGGAISLNFLFTRPQNLPTPRGIDAESAAIVFQKNIIGPTIDFGFGVQNFVAVSNAHGSALSAASDETKFASLTPQDWVTQKFGYLRLQNFIQSQALGATPRGRIVELLDNRVVFVSESGSHATSPVTNIDQLLKDIDISKAVVYVAAGSERAELDQRLRGALIVPYRIRNIELSSVILPNKAKILAGERFMGPTDIYEGWYPNQKVQLVLNVPTEFRNSLGEASGANGYWGWGIPSRSPVAPTSGHLVALHLVCSEGLPGFFSPEQIDAGAFKYIRNSWMTEVQP